MRGTSEATFYNEFNDEYSVELAIEVSVDNNYGADIDGNRGTTAYELDDEEWEVWKNGDKISFDQLVEEVEKYELDFYPEQMVDEAVDCALAYDGCDI